MSEASWTERPRAAASGATAARSRLAVAGVALAAGALTIVWRFLTFSGFNNDHYVHVARAQQLLLGEWPVRDFVDAGMPLMYVVHAAARTVFGPALGVEWAIVAVAFGLGAASTVIVASRLSGSLGVAALMAALEVAIYPRTFGYPKVLLYAAAALVIAAVGRRFNAAAVLALAVMTVIAFLFRHDHGVFIGIAAVTAVVVGGVGDGWRTAIERAAILAGVIVLLLLPWLLFVQMYQGLVGYVASAASASQGEAVGNALREVPRLRLDDIGSVRNALTWLFYTFHALPLVCVLILVRRSPGAEAWPGETAVVAALSVMAIPVNATFMRGNLDGRVPDAIVPAVLLGSWLLGQAMRHAPARAARLASAGVLVVVSAWAVVRVGEVRENLEKTELMRGPSLVGLRAADLWDRFQRRVPERDHVPSRYAQALLPFMEYVGRCTARHDRLLVTGLLPEINAIADRGFAGGHGSFRPDFYTSDADQAQTVARLRAQSVPFVVSVRQLYPDLTRQMPRLFAYLERRYQPFIHVAVPETDGVDVLVERDRASARIDTATGWPCFQ